MWVPSPEKVCAELARKMLTDPLWLVTAWQESTTRFLNTYREELARLQEQRSAE